MGRSNSSNSSKAASKAAAKTTGLEDDNDDDVEVLPSESQPSEQPKRSPSKGKKDMSKFARKTVIVPTETSNRHYVSVCELRQNVVVTWPVRVRTS